MMGAPYLPGQLPAKRPAYRQRRINARQRIWIAANVLKAFDLPYLLMAADVRRKTALPVLRALVKSGHLVAHPAQPNWRLVKTSPPPFSGDAA